MPWTGRSIQVAQWSLRDDLRTPPRPLSACFLRGPRSRGMSQRGQPGGPSTSVSHLDTREQHAAGLLRVCTLPADEDDSKRTRRGADALFFQGIEKRGEVTDRDLRVFVFRHAYGRG